MKSAIIYSQNSENNIKGTQNSERKNQMTTNVVIVGMTLRCQVIEPAEDRDQDAARVLERIVELCATR